MADGVPWIFGRSGIQKLALLGIDVSITYDSAAEEPETEQKPEEVPDTPAEIAVGSTVKIKAGATYTNGVKVPDSVTGKTYTIQQVNGKKALLKEIVSWVETKYLTAASGSAEPSEEKPATEDVDVTYRVRAGGKWYPAVKNLSDLPESRGGHHRCGHQGEPGKDQVSCTSIGRQLAAVCDGIQHQRCRQRLCRYWKAH